MYERRWRVGYIQRKRMYVPQQIGEDGGAAVAGGALPLGGRAPLRQGARQRLDAVLLLRQLRAVLRVLFLCSTKTRYCNANFPVTR